MPPKREPVSTARLLLHALGLGGAVLAGGCSTQVPHPLLTTELEERAMSIDLAAPPTVTREQSPTAGQGVAPEPATATGAPPPAPPSPPAASAAPQPPGAAAKTPAATPAPPPAAPPAAAAATPPAADVAQLDISVADVRGEAITNNLEIKTELVRPSLLTQDRLEAEARFIPTSFARYTYSKLDQPGIPNQRLPTDATTDAAELGLQIPLQTGGNAQISVPLTRTRASQVGVPGSPTLNDAAAAFSLSQPLLRDAGRAVNLAPITVARLLERQQDANTKLAIMNVLAGAERFYWNLYAASRSVEVRLQQYERAKEQERQATRLAAEGVVPAIEVVRARAGVARRIEDIIRAENGRRQVERELKRAINRPALPVSGKTSLIVTTPPEPREIIIDREAALAAAAENRMELLGLELQLAADSLAVDVARNQKLPRLALDYSFRYLGAATELNDALDAVGTSDFSDQSIGLTLEVPLDNQARRARYHRAVLQRSLDMATQAQQRQLIERQVLDAIDQLDEAWQRILAAREETLLAARNFLAEQTQFNAGVRTSTDVLIAADFLADAQIRELNAMSAYEIAKIDIAFVTGTLLGTGRVKLASFDENNDLDEVATRDVETLGKGPPASPPPTQESISRKLDRLGVKAPSARVVPGMPPLPPGAGELPGLPAREPPTAPSTAPAATPPAGDAAPASEPAAAVQPAAPAIGPVDAAATAWSLAREHRPSAEVPIADMVTALVRANPGAFPGGDPARLRAGAVLRLPTADEIALAAE